MSFCEILCSVNKLKVKQTILEKNELEFIRILEKYGYSFQQLFDNMKKTRDQISLEIRDDVNENFQFLKFIKNQLVGDTLINCDLEKLRQKMLNMENCTNDLKSRVEKELADLYKEELSLSIDVTNIEMKVSEQIKQESISEHTIINPNKIKEERQLLKEVKDFLMFVDKKGGHDGGWTHSDHILFLKLFQNFKKKSQLFQALMKLFPHKSANEISAHIDWFETYTDLKAKQRRAIQKWREGKKKDSKERTNRETENPPSVKNTKVYTENDQLIKQKIQNWKLEQQQKMEQETKTKLAGMKLAKEIEDIKQQKYKQTKEEVEKWRKNKESKYKTEKITKEIMELKDKERKMLMANKLIREFQNQDNIIITKRLNQLKINVNPPDMLSTSSRKKKPRNPDRILKSTKNWEARKVTMEENLKKFDAQIGLMKIPKLGKPHWRQTVEVN